MTTMYVYPYTERFLPPKNGTIFRPCDVDVECWKIVDEEGNLFFVETSHRVDKRAGLEYRTDPIPEKFLRPKRLFLDGNLIIGLYQEGKHQWEFVLPNKFTIAVPESNVESTSEGFYVKTENTRDFDEFFGIINAHESFMSDTTFLGKNAFMAKTAWRVPLQRTTKWSHHHDYVPTKRFIIELDRDLKKCIDDSDFGGTGSTDIGQITHVHNFVFIPMTGLYVRFSKMNYHPKQVDFTLYERFRSSVAAQKMDKYQMTQTAAIMSSLQMFYHVIPNVYEAKFACFGMFFNQNLALLARNFRPDFSVSDCWEELPNLPVIWMPYPYAGGKNAIKAIKTRPSDMIKQKTDFKLVYEESYFKSLVEEFYSKINMKEMTVNELQEAYKSGLLYTAADNAGRELFKMTTKYHYIGQVPENPTFEEMIIKRLVIENMKDVDIRAVLDRTVDYAKTIMDEKIFRELITGLSKIRFTELYKPGLNSLWKKQDPPLPEPPVLHNDQINYIIDHEMREKLIAQLAQTEADAWAKVIGWKVRQIFNNPEYIISLSKVRRGLQQCGLLGESSKATTSEPKETKKVKSSYYEKVKNTLTAPWRAGSNFIKNVEDIATGVRDFDKEELYKEAKHKLKEAFENTQMKHTTTAIMEMSFDSISNIIRTVKGLIGAWFSDLASKFCGLFGVPFEQRIDPHQLIFYYLIWTRSNDRMLKYGVLLDVLAQLGIIDCVLRMLKKIFVAVKNLFCKPEPTGAFDDYLAAQTKLVEGQNKDYKKDVGGFEDKGEVEINDDKSFVDTLCDAFTNATPTILGITATVLLSTFAIAGPKKMDHKTLGDKIISTARNVSYLSLGLAALPKIFQNVMHVFNWVYDHVKKVVKKDHSTVYEKRMRIAEWIKHTAIVPGQTEALIVRDTEYAIRYLMYMNQVPEMEDIMASIEDPKLARMFRDRVNDLHRIGTLVHSAIRISLNYPELFHVQLWSEVPGIGKTDLMNQVIDQLKKSMPAAEQHVLSALGIKTGVVPSPIGDTYCMNDCLSYADLYFNQQYGFIDEMNTHKNVDPNTIQEKMMLFSGNSCLTNQADLGSKGRVYALRAVVSNTNNGYPQFDGMLKPEAYNRRRVLFKVAVKPEYIVNGKNDFSKMTSQERTLGKHLIITQMDNVANQEHDNATTQMEVPEFLKLIDVYARLHMITEEQRLLVKSPLKALIRHKYGELNNEIYNALKDDSGSVKEQLAERMKFFQKWTAHIVKKGFKDEDAKKRFMDMSDQSYADMKNVYNTLSDDEFEVQDEALKGNFSQAVGFGIQAHLANYTLAWRQSEQGFVYYPMPSEKPMATYEDFNFDCNYFDTETINGTAHITYKTPTKITAAQEKSVLYRLIILEARRDLNDVKKVLKSWQTKQAGKKLQEKWSASLARIMQNTTEAVLSVGEWLLKTTAEIFGTSFIQGCGLLLGMIATFYSLVAVGKFLAPPEQVAYTDRRDRVDLLRLPKPQQCGSHASDDMLAIARNATHRISFMSKQGIIRGTIIGIRGNIYLANWHVMKNLTKNTTVTLFDSIRGTFQYEKGFTHLEIGPSDIERIPNEDACLVRLSGYRSTRNVFNHFMTNKDIEDNCINLRSMYVSGVLLRMNEDAKTMHYRTTGSSAAYLVDYPWNDEHTHVFATSGDFEIDFGDSGSLVIHDETRVSGRILGITLAKNTGTKRFYVGVITREMIEKTMKKFSKKDQIITHEIEYDPLDKDHPLVQVFELKTQVGQSPLPNQGISKDVGFVKSKIYGAVPVESQPALQDLRDPRYPSDGRHYLDVSLNKTNGFNMPEFNKQEERFMVDSLVSMYTRNVNRLCEARIYDTRQAITGIRMQGSTAMEMKTCAGLPYKLERGVVGKSPFIKYDLVTSTYQISNRVYNDVRMYRECYSNGQVPLNYKLEFVKKELVGQNKIDTPKTRTVGMGNFIHQILYNELFKDLYTLVKNTWENGGSMPFAFGVDPERHWDQVAKYLQFHDYVVEFDVKAWESKVSLRLLTMAADAKLKILERAYTSRNQVLPPETHMIAHALAVDFTDSNVVFEDVVYRKRAGLLSGHPGTFMENSEIHYMFISLICLRILTREFPPWANIGFIQQHVKVLLAADDVLIAISPTARKYINCASIVQGYQELGIQLTAPDKSDSIQVQTLSSCHFLKNQFQEVGGYWYPKPNKSIIYQLLNWIRSDTSLSREEQFRCNIANAFRFAWWWGEEEYESIRETVNKSLMRFNSSWDMDYNEMQVLVKTEMIRNEELARQTNPIDRPEVDSDLIIF